MPWEKSLRLTIPLILSRILVIASPAGAGAGVAHTCGSSSKKHCGGGSVSTYPTPGSAYPATVPGFENMSYWKLTVPVDSNGGTGGTAAEVKQPALATFANPAYFHASSDNQKVYFRARVDGATTSNSAYPRSELREMRSDGATSAAWSNVSGTHQMTITQAITHLPDAKPHVVAGQIHGGSSDVLQIRLEGAKLFARFEGTSSYDQTLNSNYQLGTMFTVVIRADASGIAVYYDDGSVRTQVGRNVKATAATWYFKAGCYTQSNDSVPNEPAEAYGEVLIDSITITPVT
jgi:hypothetical protein